MRGRIGAPKSRSGCKTCKYVILLKVSEFKPNHDRIRRVKCGEERPKCLRCASTGRKCDFDTDGNFSSVLSTPTSLGPSHTLSLSPISGRRERRAFGYYFQHAAQYLSGGMDIDFWTGVVPQICRTEPAVWDAIIAISALFEYPEQSSHFTFLGSDLKRDHALNQTQKEALTWYSRSISGIHSQIERGSADPYIALVSCVLFICVETLQGRMEEALRLLQQGFSLIQDLRIKASHGTVSATKSALLENTIVPLFLRLNTNALNISGTPVSNLFSFSEDTEYVFTSLASARQGITTLAAECMIFQRDAEMHLQAVGGDQGVNQEFLLKQEGLRFRLARWLHAYTELCQNLRCTSSPTSEKLAHTEPTLLTYHAAALILVAGCLTQHENVYDTHMAEFQTIVEQSSLTLEALARPNGAPPPFTFGMGVGLPLYLTALKCRHPTLRRRALQLLQQGPPIQGFYKCPPGIAMAGCLMTLEESYSIQLAQSVNQSHAAEVLSIINSGDNHDSNLQLSVDIPEEARICDAGVFKLRNGLPHDVSQENVAKWNRGPEQLFVSFRRLRHDSGSDAWEIIHDCVPMEF